MIKAVIDVGTNSTRLYVAKVKDAEQEKLLKELSTTRLGEGIGSENVIAPIPMQRTVECIDEYVRKAKTMGASEIYVYATAMVREAQNKCEFAKNVYDKCGINVEIIPGELEAKIAYLGACGRKKDCGVIDIGGGSTEVITNISGFNALSQKIGGVRLKEKFSKSDGRVDIDAVKNFAGGYMPYYETTNIKKAKTLIGVSGTPTTIASFALGLKEYIPEKIQDYILKREVLEKYLKNLADMTDEQRIAYSGEFAPRADIIVYGGCILLEFMEYFKFDEITVSDRDSLEGFLEYKESCAGL